MLLYLVVAFSSSFLSPNVLRNKKFVSNRYQLNCVANSQNTPDPNNNINKTGSSETTNKNPNQIVLNFFEIQKNLISTITDLNTESEYFNNLRKHIENEIEVTEIQKNIINNITSDKNQTKKRYLEKKSNGRKYKKFDGFDQRNTTKYNNINEIQLHFERKKLLELLKNPNIGQQRKLLLIKKSNINSISELNSDLYSSDITQGGLFNEWDFDL